MFKELKHMVAVVVFIIWGITAELQGESIDGVHQHQTDYLGSSPWSEDHKTLVRHRREATENATSSDKSFFEEIEEFYSDKNNMAMYCVLPIMVLIYGGCSAIYCVHRCRRYIRRRKHKRLKEDDRESLNSDKNDLNQEDKSSHSNVDRPISQISQAWTDLGDGNNENNNVQWSGQTSVAQTTSPLPWQVDNKSAAVAALAQNEGRRTNMSRATYVNDRLQEDISMKSGSKGHNDGSGSRASSRASILEDKLLEEEFKEDYRKNHYANLKIVAGATAASTAASAFGESTDDRPMQQQQQQQHQQQSKRLQLTHPSGESRTAANLTDYTNKSSKVKATDYSRFSDSKPIEIVPLSADPSLRVWDPLHKRPWGERSQSRGTPKIEPIGEAASRNGGSIQAMKDEVMARYDALSTFQMAKKAAEILKTNAVEKSPFQRKPNKKKNIFIAE